MDKETIDKILAETEAGYDLVSGKFSETRRHFWRGMEFIADYAQEGDKVLDFGCGNGRLLELFGNKKINYTGVDVSQKLLDLGQKKYIGENINFSKISASQTTLPFAGNFFNGGYSIAVFNHFPKKRAETMARELYRVTAPGGYLVVSVWSLWQKKYFKNILKNWLRKLSGQSELGWNDCFISFKNNEGHIFQRFHHAFRQKELDKIFTDAGFALEKRQATDSRNLLFIGWKEAAKKQDVV